VRENLVVVAISITKLLVKEQGATEGPSSSIGLRGKKLTKGKLKCFSLLFAHVMRGSASASKHGCIDELMDI
jgi:hypothetical protein